MNQDMNTNGQSLLLRCFLTYQERKLAGEQTGFGEVWRELGGTEEPPFVDWEEDGACFLSEEQQEDLMASTWDGLCAELPSLRATPWARVGEIYHDERVWNDLVKRGKYVTK